ncbi:MAG: 30S ribosomal protein S6 [Ardenticatenaceae bacterium]|nr:30S ribosomal protein S6 [Anaerolineales bacterium]MCB8921672.1 30S ribosomal protein S6 [Ardenticatenaceae bacterium]MCB9003296.1 30S ribosomal protein S6 [Ardenticatenaceae bacterium]
MRDYEIIIILQPELEDEARDSLLERIQGWIAPDGAEASSLQADHWGMRQMAYAIRKFNRGFYAYYEAQVAPERIAEIERNLQYTEDVLRYMFVRKES